MSSDRLVRRIVVEARAYANADPGRDKLQLGRVCGLLEVGVIAGYWRKRDADAAGVSISSTGGTPTASGKAGPAASESGSVG